jgi:hypothetical protein
MGHLPLEMVAEPIAHVRLFSIGTSPATARRRAEPDYSTDEVIAYLENM